MSACVSGQPIRLVIGFSPGSASDFIATLLAPELSRRLGCEIVIERHAGENGAIGARQVAAATPDGATLFIATLGTHALAPHFLPHPGYDAVEDFRPVCLVSRSPLVLACHPSIAAGSVTQLLAMSRTGTQRLTFASSAVGGAPHLAGELFKALAQIEMTHVPYARTEQLYEELQEGHVALSFNNIMSMAPRVKSGTLKGIAVTGPERSALLPELPTIAESGLPGYEVTNWLGIVAPARTPVDTIDRLNAAITAALGTPAIAGCLLQAGIEPCGGAPGVFARHIETELARWRPVIARIARESTSI
jgi:tripartite-type tricarboxylate transporter receptor subunit TctC